MPAFEPRNRNERDADLINGSTRLLGEAEYAPANYVRSNFSSVIDNARVSNAKIVITEHRRPAAAVVPVNEFRILRLLEVLGVTESISELTYTDVSIAEAIAALTTIIKNAESQTDVGGTDGPDHTDPIAGSSKRP